MSDRSPPPTKFRFKSKSESKPQDSEPSDDRRHRRRHRHHRSSHRHYRRHRSRHDSERTRSDRSRSPSTLRPRPASPDTAFRESLFDALADDEGAAYWEGVYGQPIHTYSRYRGPAQEEDGGPAIDENGNPILERMTDDEYVSYVRGKMWEKSHAYIFEERAKREAAREKRKTEEQAQEQARREHRDRAVWDDMIQGAADRRRGRDKVKEAKAAWDRYSKAWEELKLAAESTETAKQGEQKDAGALNGKSGSGYEGVRIPWPTLSGRSKDIGKDEVEAFFRNSPTIASPEADPLDLLALVKTERIRWHPDKMMQRYGALATDTETMKRITAVFQILDKFWTELKGNT